MQTNSLIQYKRKVERGFTIVPNGLLQKRPKNISASSWLLFLFLYSQGKQYHPSQELIAKLMDVDKGTVKKWCDELKKAHHLKVVRIGKRAYVWELHEIPFKDAD